MAHTFANLLTHVIFSTKDREPLIDEALKHDLLAGLAQRRFLSLRSRRERPLRFQMPLATRDRRYYKASICASRVQTKDRGPQKRRTALLLAQQSGPFEGRSQLALKFLAFTAHRCYTNQQQAHDP